MREAGSKSMERGVRQGWVEKIGKNKKRED